MCLFNLEHVHLQAVLICRTSIACALRNSTICNENEHMTHATRLLRFGVVYDKYAWCKVDGPLLHLCWYIYLLLCGVCENRKRNNTTHDRTYGCSVPHTAQTDRPDLVRGYAVLCTGYNLCDSGRACWTCMSIYYYYLVWLRRECLSGSGVNAMCAYSGRVVARCARVCCLCVPVPVVRCHLG